MGCDIHAYVEYRRPYPDGKEHWFFFADVNIGRNYRLFALAATVRMQSWGGQMRQIAEVYEKHGIPMGANDQDFAQLPEEKREAFLKDISKCDGDTGITMGQEPFQPKGIPKPLSYRVQNRYTLYVYEKEEGDPGEEGCTRESAEGWVKNKSSEWWNEDKTMVTDPDWHTPSWLSTEEVKQLLHRMEEAQRACIPAAKKEHAKMVELAKEYERKNPGKTARKDLQSWAFYNPMKDDSLTELRAVVGMMEALEEGGAVARLVFWFDN